MWSVLPPSAGLVRNLIELFIFPGAPEPRRHVHLLRWQGGCPQALRNTVQRLMKTFQLCSLGVATLGRGIVV